MARAADISYYADLIASLMVSAARTTDREALSEIRAELAEAFADIFALLDSEPAEQSFLSALTASCRERQVSV